MSHERMTPQTIAVSKEMQNLARRLDKDIQSVTGTRFAFMLIVFTPGRASWINTVKREDAIQQLEDLLALWKADMPDIPAHEVQS